MNVHKKHQRGDNLKLLTQRLSFLYATHCHDLLYIIVKYHQNIPNGFQVIERKRNGRTDARLIAIPLEPFDLGIKISRKFSFFFRFRQA